MRPLDVFNSLKVKVPSNLASVLTIDHRSEESADQAGLRPKDIAALWHTVERLYQSGAYPGLSFCLRRKGHIVFNRGLGHARGNGPQEPPSSRQELLTPDSPICLFSASKAVTAILAHLLAEEGGLDLDKPVAYYIPEFGAAGKSATTVAQVLAHRGGFPTLDLPAENLQPELLMDWQKIVRIICEAPPTPGRKEKMSYHAVTGGFIVAEIIQRITNKPVSDYLDKRIRKPLGMKYFTYGLEPKYRDRVALNYEAGTKVRFPVSVILEKALMAPMERVVEVSNSNVFMEAVIPAGNIYSTAEELSRFYQLLLNGGEWNGKQIIKRATIERAVRPAGSMSFDRTLNIPMLYSEGLMMGGAMSLYGPNTGGAYGHLGFLNILGWADPNREIAVSLLTTGKAVLGTHLISLLRLLTTISQRC
jgi:CubicO group peptidase (beta-lactamase class C family)